MSISSPGMLANYGLPEVAHLISSVDLQTVVGGAGELPLAVTSLRFNGHQI